MVCIQNSALHYIPEPPSPPLSDTGSEIVEQLTALGEPTLQSLGLGSWYPNGLVQSGLEALHVGLNIPWWTSIVLGKLIIFIHQYMVDNNACLLCTCRSEYT